MIKQGVVAAQGKFETILACARTVAGPCIASQAGEGGLHILYKTNGGSLLRATDFDCNRDLVALKDKSQLLMAISHGSHQPQR